METHEVYLQTFDSFPLITLQMSTGYPNSSHVRRNRDTSTLALEALEGTVTSEIGIPGLLHIVIGRSRMEWGPGI
jgi:hypothetical protein